MWERQMTPLSDYATLGWSMKPVPAGKKRSVIKGWPDIEFAPADFADGMNIAIRLGKCSRDLADCDLDCEEAIALARSISPRPVLSSVAHQSRDPIGSTSQRARCTSGSLTQSPKTRYSNFAQTAVM